MLNIQKVRYGQDDHTYSSRDKELFFEVDDEVFNEIEDEETCQDIQNINGKLVRCSYLFHTLTWV